MTFCVGNAKQRAGFAWLMPGSLDKGTLWRFEMLQIFPEIMYLEDLYSTFYHNKTQSDLHT